MYIDENFVKVKRILGPKNDKNTDIPYSGDNNIKYDNDNEEVNYFIEKIKEPYPKTSENFLLRPFLGQDS